MHGWTSQRLQPKGFHCAVPGRCGASFCSVLRLALSLVSAVWVQPVRTWMILSGQGLREFSVEVLGRLEFRVQGLRAKCSRFRVYDLGFGL